MTDRKTLQLRSPDETADAAPAIRKKGRGWEISEKRLDALHDMAREKRRHSTPAHKALAEKFAKADLGKWKFTRHAVIGSAIVDFASTNLGLAIMIDEEDADPALATRRDRSLEAVGIKVMRIAAADVLEDMDAVLARITDEMRMRIADKKSAARKHAAENPNQHYERKPNDRSGRRNTHAQDR
ncbi:endonuclease domain-containing protein [Tsuneonella sp. SYSU-LHT278]|uniref:endonuclease domain-containing protein n=1 Tax=Tsuneonella sediminis TaxID=3416089 RepID=UPI003F79C92A